MIKVLGLALYGPLAASTRYRLGQYVPGLASTGIDLQIVHLLGDDYLRGRFSGDSINLAGLLKSALARLGDLWHQHEYDVVILHCELFPLMPGWMERALIRIPYIYDFDDAFYLKYRKGRLGIPSLLLAHKFDAVMDNNGNIDDLFASVKDLVQDHLGATSHQPYAKHADNLHIPS